MLHLFQEQPRAFRMIFMLELWERFGFYTVQGILTLYLMRYLGFSDVTAYYTFGAYSALVYGLVVIGGYLGDKILGTKRTLVLGLIVLIFGYLSLAITDKQHAFLALGFICIGNGLFKANPSNLLAKCYEEQDPRLHGGFTLYYMAINLGSMFALLIGPAIASKYGYSPAYMLSALGLGLGLLNYGLYHRHLTSIQTGADARIIPWWQWFLIGGCIVLAAEGAAYLLQQVDLARNLLLAIVFIVTLSYFYVLSKANNIIRKKMVVALILMIEAIIFFTLYQQMPTSLNLYAVNNVMPNILGISLDPQSFQALNPIWIIVMSPVLASIYRKLHQKNIGCTVPYKFAFGMTMCACSFLILYCSRYFYNAQGQVASFWLIISYLFQSLGELLVSALGVAMVAELVPASIAGFVMGMWFLTTAIAGFVGASVAAFTALPLSMKPGVQSLMIYTHVFAYIGVITLIIAMVMWCTAPLLNRYIGIIPLKNDE